MKHDPSLTPSFSPSSFFGHVPEGGHLLPAGHIHVWRAIVDLPFTRLQVQQTILSPDERERAARFKRSQHQRRYIAARGILRHILARYLPTPPRNIHFQAGPFGKPLLQEPVEPPLHFNVAHSQQLALYAISRDFEIGIDLEGDRQSLDYAGLAERICSTDELMTFLKLPQAEQREAFFRCWTRKEAFVKAIGKGFSFPLKNVKVSFTADEPSRILSPRLKTSGTGSQGQSSDEWSLFDLPLGQGFWGALAVKGNPSLIQGWDYRLED